LLEWTEEYLVTIVGPSPDLNRDSPECKYQAINVGNIFTKNTIKTTILLLLLLLLFATLRKITAVK
jgi:hypothetical protein